MARQIAATEKERCPCEDSHQKTATRRQPLEDSHQKTANRRQPPEDSHQKTKKQTAFVVNKAAHIQ